MKIDKQSVIIGVVCIAVTVGLFYWMLVLYYPGGWTANITTPTPTPTSPFRWNP